ncbi:hypothetical protein TNIN_139601 [Trichonephila inaurata madagascariensis]|uniref:Uncharacterized protein n=1 Tax=Trichonephila inaurata madagascariensis TaxID=2747483 RepID=A0A8X7C3W9_9ARAC|nr:hypothetical protein TNIN_139601 [Trichonephila inaurata madagascariensis]
MFSSRLRNAKALFRSGKQSPIFPVPDLRIRLKKEGKALLGWSIYRAYTKTFLLMQTLEKDFNHVWNARQSVSFKVYSDIFALHVLLMNKEHVSRYRCSEQKVTSEVDYLVNKTKTSATATEANGETKLNEI